MTYRVIHSQRHYQVDAAKELLSLVLFIMLNDMLNLGDLPKKHPNMNVMNPCTRAFVMPAQHTQQLLWRHVSTLWAWPLLNKAQTGRHLAQNELSSSLGTGTQECWFFSLAASEDK